MRPIRFLFVALPVLICTACSLPNNPSQVADNNPNANPLTYPTKSTAFTPTPDLGGSQPTRGGSPLMHPTPSPLAQP